MVSQTKITWSEDLAKGFEECMRVLKIGGTLVFKWSDCQVNVNKILESIPFKPLFGQQRGTTHWMTFVNLRRWKNDSKIQSVGQRRKEIRRTFFITDNGLICNMEKLTSGYNSPIPIEKSELILMQSTGLFDKNGKEIFEKIQSILKAEKLLLMARVLCQFYLRVCR